MTRFPTLITLAAATLAIAATGWSQTPSEVTNALIAAQRLALKARTGDTASAVQAIAGLEAATTAHPESAPLWAALGNAHITMASLGMTPGGDPSQAAAGFRAAPAAYEKALKIDPDNVMALSGHGTFLQAMAGFRGMPDLSAQGMVEMNRAIQLAPQATAPRLNRAFAAVNLPLAKRDNATAIEDLTFLWKVAPGSRQGDLVRIMLGDVHYEMGKPDLARAQYEAVAKPGGPAEAEARSRLGGLAAGAVDPAEIKRLRDATGRHCAMCHAG